VLQMLPLAAHSQAARAELSVLAQEAGGPATTSMSALRRWIGESGMSAKQLGDFVNSTTGKLADMASVAANLGTVLQSQLTAAFDQAREKASGFDANLSALSNEMASHASPSSQGYQTALRGVINSMAQMHVSIPVVTGFLRSMGVNISQAGVQSLIAAGKFASTGHSASAAGASMNTAAGAANNLRGAIGALQSKTITVTTYYRSLYTSSGGRTSQSMLNPGYQWGTDYATAGMHLVGERGPELVLFGGGERVLDNSETRQFLSGGEVSRTQVTPAASAAQQITLHATIPVTATVDGRALFTAQQQETLRFNVRNGNPGAGTMAPPRPGG